MGKTRHPIRALALLAGLFAATAQADPAATLADCDAGFERVLMPQAAPLPAARALWVDGTRLRWPGPAAAPDGTGSRFRLHHAASPTIAVRDGEPVSGADGAIELRQATDALPAALEARVRWAGAGVDLQLHGLPIHRLRALHRSQLLLTEEDAQGRVRRAATLQHPLALDALFARAETAPGLGVHRGAKAITFGLWAPTATAVSVCLHARPADKAAALLPLRRDAATGVWRGARPRAADTVFGADGPRYYSYLVDVLVPGVGRVRNRVGDPWALSLSAESRHSWIGTLDEPATRPAGWHAVPRPPALARGVDSVVYELHPRDFSINDNTVPAADRGKYLAFGHAGSDGMRHLRRLAAAGVTEVHLLPVFDIASVPERGCGVPPDTTPEALARLPSASDEQQRRVRAAAARDCFNWGYDPLHFGAPEGSYASDPDDGATRVREFRAMVMGLHAAGLRVGLDVVYNHTSASGQRGQSTLDRIVPGYWHRLDGEGRVTTSTCCDNTATEHRMMARLMVDTAVRWVRDYRIDAFRFDLMGHQPRAAMLRLQQAVDHAAGRRIALIGEGWNFGEVVDGKRFVQAAQGRLAGTGIGTFSDRARDAVRGGGCCDAPAQVLQRQGWVNGLHVAPNAHAGPAGDDSRRALQRAAELLRAGLAGTLAAYPMPLHDGRTVPLAELDYAGQRAGYASQPDEVVNYVENHDNPTLWDLNLLKLPLDTPPHERARVQLLALATTAFSQGVAYLHAGVELLRSKNGDRNSFDSGDWFNRIDWTAQDNFFGGGLPPEPEKGGLWAALRPLLAAPQRVKPTPADIAFTRDGLLDLLRIRSGTTLLRLGTADEVAQRLRFHATGPEQDGSLVVGEVDGRGLDGARWRRLVYALHAGLQPATLRIPALQGQALRLHPVQADAAAADPRPREQSRWDPATATLTVPPRTALVYVLD